MITKAVAEEIGAPSITITLNTRATDIEGWDSIAHSRILAALEETIDVALDFDRGFALADVGGLVALIHEAIEHRNC